LLALALEVFRPAVSPRSKWKVVRPLSSFEPSSEAPGRRCLVSPRRRSHDSMRSASHELLRPSSVRMQASRIIARFHPDSIPLRPFSDPWGLDPRKHLRPCCMPLTLMGFRRPELFPVNQLFPARHRAIPSRPSCATSGDAPPGPSGLSVSCRSVPSTGVLHPAVGRCSLRLSSLPRLSLLSGCDSPSTAHPLMASASNPFTLVLDADLQRLPPKSPGISHSRERRPP
jgi:hypothetical protein